MGQALSDLYPNYCGANGMDVLSAARRGDKQYLQEALTAQPVLLVLANYNGTTLLHLAAQEGGVEVLELLVGLIETHAATLAAAVSNSCLKKQQQQQPEVEQQQLQSQQHDKRIIKSRQA